MNSKDLKKDERKWNNSFNRGYIQAQKENICSLCKENLEGSQILCWNCLCKIKDDVRKDVKKDILEIIDNTFSNMEALLRHRFEEIDEIIGEIFNYKEELTQKIKGEKTEVGK
jgi:hypothetical protein